MQEKRAKKDAAKLLKKKGDKSDSSPSDKTRPNGAPEKPKRPSPPKKGSKPPHPSDKKKGMKPKRRVIEDL